MITIPQTIRDRNRPNYNIRSYYKNPFVASHDSKIMVRLRVDSVFPPLIVWTETAQLGVEVSRWFSPCVWGFSWGGGIEWDWLDLLSSPPCPPFLFSSLSLLVTHLSPSPTINHSLFAWTLYLPVILCEFLYTEADKAREQEPKLPGLSRTIASTTSAQLLPWAKARHTSPGSKKGKQTLTLDWRTFVCIQCPVAHIYLCRQPTRIDLLLLWHTCAHTHPQSGPFDSQTNSINTLFQKIKKNERKKRNVP